MSEAKLWEAPEEVLPGVLRVGARMYGPDGIHMNAYAVTDGEDAVMVDTAWWTDLPSTHVDELVLAARARGSELRSVFLTHAHRDHSGFAAHLSQASETTVPILLHRDEKPTVAAMRNFQGLDSRDDAVRWYEGFGFPRDAAATIVDTKYADYPLEDKLLNWCDSGEIIRAGSRELQVIPTPGHTPGHAALWEEQTGILFSGDALLPRGAGNPHVTVRAFTSPDPLSDYVRGIEGLRALNARVCLPGHGSPVEDVDALIASHLDYAAKKLEPVVEVLSTMPKTAFEVASDMRWRGRRKRFDELVNDEWFLAFADTLARIRRLVTLGTAVESLNDDGVPIFHKAK